MDDAGVSSCRLKLHVPCCYIASIKGNMTLGAAGLREILVSLSDLYCVPVVKVSRA